MKQRVYLGIQEFAVPAPRSGSIEAGSGINQGLQKGIELHQLIQKKRKHENSNYRSEVKLTHEFETEEFLFVLEGRLDGIYDEPIPHIEEIKSTFNLHDLKKNLKNKNLGHPYNLQLQTYAYFYWLKNKILPTVSFHLISTRTGEDFDLTIPMDIDEYEAWLKLRLEELVIEARRASKRIERRKKTAVGFPFPFTIPRAGQVELIQTIEDGMNDNRPMMIQAPTGLGKTVGVLYPGLKNALSRGQSVIYITPKNSQQRVAEEAIEKFQEQGSHVKSLTLTAKSKLCMKAEPLCTPEYCEFAKDYYDKVHQHDLKNQLFKKKKITSRIIKNMAEKYQVCPFELQLEAVEEMDTVICDYNYVFANRSALNRINALKFDDEGKPNLVIDEAHNLPSRTMSYYSPVLSVHVLEKMKDEMKLLPKRFAADGEILLHEAIEVIKSLAPSSGKNAKINPNIYSFMDMEEGFKSFLSKYLDSEVEIKPKDVVLRAVFYWAEFTEVLKQVVEKERSQFFISYQHDFHAGSIKITCCDASEFTRPKFEDYQNIIAFSATLKPFDYYARLSGMESEKLLTAEFLSPFDRERRKVLVIPQVSTKFSERERNYGKVAETIERVASLKSGNYLAFFPSFDFLERTLKLFKTPPGFQTIKQDRFMKNSEIDSILENLKLNQEATILFAVQGGHFSEGVDYPGDMVIGAFVIGPPLPNFDFERENLEAYYQAEYQQGFNYAYAYPAMAKAIQSAGRVIRSETDKGIIVLMDDRFLEHSYSQSMPTDWFEGSPRELVSKSILQDVQNFWNQD